VIGDPTTTSPSGADRLGPLAIDAHVATSTSTASLGKATTVLPGEIRLQLIRFISPVCAQWRPGFGTASPARRRARDVIDTEDPMDKCLDGNGTFRAATLTFVLYTSSSSGWRPNVGADDQAAGGPASRPTRVR